MVPQGAREKPQGLPCSQIVMLDVRKLEELCRVVIGAEIGAGAAIITGF